MKLLFVLEDRENDPTAKASISELAGNEAVSPDEIINSITNDVDSVAKTYELTSYCYDVLHSSTQVVEPNFNKKATDISVDSTNRKALKEALLTYILKDIRETLFATNNFVIDRAWELAGEWSSNDYKVVTEGGLDSELVEEIINRLTIK